MSERRPVPRPVPVLVLALVGVLLAGCAGGPILANEPLAFPSPATPTAEPSRPADPVPVAFPRDDGPHDRLTEWWYYTGHLRAEDGRRFGFEAVIFRAERGSVPAAWAAHLALTDEQGNRFLYAQRSEVGAQVDRSPRDVHGEPTGFDLAVSGIVQMGATSDGVGGPPSAPWQLAGANGTDRIVAALAPFEATTAGGSFGLALDLRSTKPPALHDHDGFVDFGPAGSSYYYSRTRLAATGEVQLEGERFQVTGIAWFDHQWGDFVSVGAGGWDWFAINLDDGTDITVSVVYDAVGAPVYQYGTLVTGSGEVRNLGPDDVIAATGGYWLSPATERGYPTMAQVLVDPYTIDLQPTLLNQELDTRATTGVIYWEGSQVVTASRLFAGDIDPTPIGGEAYIEITRYGR